jgi:tetratricopeptide (TPR) repeat protein
MAAVPVRGQDAAGQQGSEIDLTARLKDLLIEGKAEARNEVLRGLFQGRQAGRERLGNLKRAIDGILAKPAAGVEGEAKPALADLVAGVAGAADKLADMSGHEDVKRVGERVQTLYDYYVFNFVAAQIQTRAIYAGQYKALAELGPEIVDKLTTWTLEVPLFVRPGDAFRATSINALRDLVSDEPPATLMKNLKEIARDAFEDPDVQSRAIFALAQFGDRELADKQLKAAEELTKSDSAEKQVEGWSELARIQYELRDYKQAVAAYKGLMAKIEAGSATPQGLPTLYYNMACSMALAGMTDEAFQYLEKAVETGKKPGQQPMSLTLFQVDMDIQSLRPDPRFKAFMEKHFGNGAGNGGDKR